MGLLALFLEFFHHFHSTIDVLIRQDVVQKFLPQ